MKAKRLAWTAVGAVTLALVVFLGGALSSSDAPSPSPTPQSDPKSAAETLAREAAAALSGEDTATAVKLAENALKLDPENVQASTVLLRTAPRTDSSPVPQDDADRDDPDGTDPDAEDARFLSETEELAAFLPSSVGGWEAGQVVDIAPDALVTYQPDAGSDADAQTKRAVFSVHDMRSPTKADKFVAGVAKAAYVKDASTVPVGSVKKAYFGTDGSAVAVVVFARGRYAFEVLLVAESGVKPSSLKGMATDLAAGFPAAK